MPANGVTTIGAHKCQAGSDCGSSTSSPSSKTAHVLFSRSLGGVWPNYIPARPPLHTRFRKRKRENIFDIYFSFHLLIIIIIKNLSRVSRRGPGRLHG